MVEKGFRGGIFHAIDRYTKVNNKYLKDCDKNNKLSYVKYWDIIICVVGQCHNSCL